MGNLDIKILVVDDEKVNRMLLRSYLELTYSNVLEAEDGPSALNMLKDHDVSIILLDLMMPRMSGYEVLKILRAHQKFQFVPVIVVTALNNEQDNAKAIELGADGFLTKPFNKVILGALVKNLLYQHEIQKKLLEAEKNEVFYATVVTANHEINQPLTEILCSLSLLENSYEGNKIRNVEKFTSYINNVSNAARKISDTLKKLRLIKNPLIKTYVDSIKMLNIDELDEPKPLSIDTLALESDVGKSILIVDEENLIANLVCDLLGSKGFKVLRSASYQRIVKDYKNDRKLFDLAIIDVKEREKDGLQLFYNLKSINKDVKVILSSADNIKDDIINAIKEGADAFIPKPYDTDNLFFLINKILQK